MRFKSAYVVLAIGIIFVISSVFRIFGFLIPSMVVALISVIAALISLSDVFEITRFKKYGIPVQIFALFLFICSMSIWLLKFDFNFPIAQTIGDSFTVLGLGIVIGLYGLKEILDHNKDKGKTTEDPNKVIENFKFSITLNEYEEMMRINDIIERLKKLDQEVLPYNKVHNGWASLYESLAEHWNRWKGPFYDGMNRSKYYDFLRALDHATEQIGNIADTDYRSFGHRKVVMWNESIDVTIQPRINNRYIASIKDVVVELDKALVLWDEIKNLVNKRYEKERSEQRSPSQI